MRSLIGLLLISIFLTAGSCSVFKKKNRQSTESNTTEKTDIQIERDEIKTQTDNIRIQRTVDELFDESILIFPRGEFTIGTDNTFIGEADSIRIQRNSKRFENDSISVQATSFEGTNTTIQDKSETHTDIFSKKMESETVKKPNLIPYLGIGIAVVFIFLVIIFAIKKLRIL